MENSDQAYLGTGWGFPPTFQLNSSHVRMVSAEEDIRESLHILLSTSLGERVMQPEYGCNLQDYLFNPLSPTVASEIKQTVYDALLYHEPRIQLNQVELSLDEALGGVVLISIDYTIISTNSRFNLVYPFYRQEGSGILPESTANAVAFEPQISQIANALHS